MKGALTHREGPKYARLAEPRVRVVGEGFRGFAAGDRSAQPAVAAAQAAQRASHWEPYSLELLLTRPEYI
ncbi:hypothetical protein NDU88_004079 [Pleurodeles waltl]|uniref:Uncharacterized protein n=1 Tax=Pleurodeles waltl TaxID=8319 RepID=A0AAV7SHR9_PLEWA|nr:hypothetical protein NDU88_004079 [Pleurodeles waltl]